MRSLLRRSTALRSVASPLRDARLHEEGGAEDEACVICGERIEPGDSVIFTADGVAHVECYLDARRPKSGEEGCPAIA
jgi:hypothetical protein